MKTEKNKEVSIKENIDSLECIEFAEKFGKAKLNLDEEYLSKNIEEVRKEIIENGSGHENLLYACLYGKPELHRQAVIDRGDGLDNYGFANKFDKPELHRQVVIERGNAAERELFSKRFGEPELNEVKKS
jgi:hypothetical protein